MLDPVSDPALRGLERALAAGEETARLPLATAYLRQGRSTDALDLLAVTAGLAAEATAVHEAAWRRELATLAPVPAELGDAATGDALIGWFGPGLRYAAIGGPRRLRVVDLVRAEVILPSALPIGVTPVATSLHALYGRSSGEVLRLEPPRAEGEPWRWEPVHLPYPDARFVPSPDGTRVIARDQGIDVLAAWPDFDTILTLGPPGANDVDWRSGRVAWWSQGRVFVSPLDRSAPGQIIDVRRSVLADAPLLAAALPAGPGAAPRLFQFLADGRLLLGPPLVVLDPATGGYAAPLGGRDLELDGPARLARDRTAILVFRDGLPLRVPLEGGEPARRPAAGRGGAVAARAWHPQAEVAATSTLDRGQPEVRGAEGETVRALPRDVRPLGWTPDGRGLLVHRVRGLGGGLELWRTQGQGAPA
jgi:hypothetical protein